jgi:succinate dehydrogenase / fumarate reductase cytochrome b subunit
MTIHLLTNSSILASSQKFQSLVYQIHALGPALPLVEWIFIFLPLIFHAVMGVVIVKGGLPNTSSYSYSGNIRYSLQRASGMVAFVFIFWHVFHMHGWIHAEWWIELVKGWGANFSPYNASSTAAAALASPVVLLLYAIGVLSCVFHLSNGIWTMGITWGLWVSPAAQKRANWLAIGFGVALAFVSMGALTGFGSMSEEDIKEARRVEDLMFDQKVATGEVEADSHKKARAGDQEDHAADEEDHADQAAHDLQRGGGEKTTSADQTAAVPTALLK